MVIMETNNFSIIRPRDDVHLRRIGQLCADAFSNGEYVDQYCENYIGNSHYDWDLTRVIMDGEKMIHHWGVWKYAMRLESILLDVAGIGAVTTHSDYRKQGLMHLAAKESFADMRSAGVDLSILRGRHYVKMGYARAWNYVHYNIGSEDLAKFVLKKPYRSLEPDEVKQMDALYNREYAGYTGSAIRPTYLKRHPEDICVYAWFDDEGQLEGYVRALPDEDSPKILLCVEATGDPLQGLAVLADLFKGRSDCEQLKCFTLPYLHPMLQYLRKGAVIVEDRYFDITGWRVRLIDLQGALKKMIPLFEKRLVDSRFADWQGSLMLDAGIQQGTLDIDRGRVDVKPMTETIHSIRGGADIARLLIGSDEPEEIIRQADMKCDGLSIAFARVLFPNLHPMMSMWDEY